jgi:hypothetical protein
MRARLTSVALSSVIGLSACTGAPSAPSPSASAPSAAPSVLVAILGLDNGAAVGMPLALSGTATSGDGAATAFTTGADWTSSNPSVATIDQAGRVTPLAEGTTTIGAAVKGGAAAATLTVYMNIEGDWQYSFLPVGCGDQGGSSIGMGCRRDGPEEKTKTAVMTQQGRLVTITATPSIGTLFPSVRIATGTLTSDRRLTLSGKACSIGDWTEVGYVVRDWNVSWSDATQVFSGTARWEQNGPYGGCGGGPTNYSIQVGANVYNFRRK